MTSRRRSHPVRGRVVQRVVEVVVTALMALVFQAVLLQQDLSFSFRFLGVFFVLYPCVLFAGWVLDRIDNKP